MLSGFNNSVMKKLRQVLLFSLLFSGFVKAQTDPLKYFQSYFETISDQQQWSSQPPDDIKKWTFQTGGYDHFNPDTAYAGNINAFHFWSDFNPDTRTLVSVPIDLSDSKKPQLSFGHAMFQSVFGTDKLVLLFKAGSSAPWEAVATYTSPVNQWTLRTFNIKDIGTKYLCKDFQLAFQSTAQGGHGVCIDDVIIEEKDVIIRYVKTLTVRNVVQDPIPSGVTDLPVMRIGIQVVGNTDPIVLDSITIKSLSSHDSLFAANGFELVATKDSIYRPTTKTGTSLKIGSAVSISSGKITFNNLNYSLSTGYNAIWLVTDVKRTAPHKSIADFKVEASAIKINTSKYPAAEISPAGYNTIEQSVFFDNFEGANTWTLQSDFEIAVPKGLIAHITADPDFAYSGTKALGTDLVTDGKYRLNISAASAYYATAPAINLQYYADVKLSFKKWIAFEGNDHGVIEVTTDNGTTWQRIWTSKTDALTPDIDWVNYCLTDAFNAIAAHQPSVRIRFGIIYSDNNFAYAGFNIDNFAVTGNYLTNDVGITSLIRPLDDCNNPGMDKVEITVKNYADRATASTIPVFFSIDGSDAHKVYDTLVGPIPKDGTVTFLFTRAANFPGPGQYSSFKVKLEAPGDQDAKNDALIEDIFVQRSISLPDLERFETGSGYWKKYSISSDPTWMCKIPDGSIPPLPGSPNAWILSPYGNYITGDTTFIESSCYDLAQSGRSIFEMKLWMDSEAGKDGALIEYSKNDGANWTVLPANEYGWNWNWYNGAVSALGTSGWSGLNTQNWRTVKQVLPATLSIEPKVKFRVKWASDNANTYRGMAVDEVRLYAAPVDIGVFKIDSFANRCQHINPDRLTVTIKNLGINPLKQNDTVIVGFDFNRQHMAVDTFMLGADLLPGQTIKHTFSEPVDVSEPGSYNLTAYTLIEDDPYFYLSNNDTTSLDFQVYPGPITSLADTIQTHLPDTVVLATHLDAAYDYWWNGVKGTDTYHVQDAGWQRLTVTATRGNGCSSYDSTNVELLFNDAGAVELVYPVSNCGLTKHEYPVVRVKNYGTDSIAVGQKIAVVFRLNAGAPVSDTLKLTSTFHSGHTLDFTFTRGPVDLSQQGTFNFKLYTAYGGDTIALNDTITRSIVILGRPVVNLGPDKTVQALSHTLDAGSGFQSYLWDNGTSARTREVTQSGSYWVRVTDQNACDNADTAYIRLKIRDISPGGFASPVSDCQFSAAALVSLKVLNSGTDTIPSGTAVAVSYTFNGGARVNGTVNLASDLLPGVFVLYNFPGTVNLSNPADYNFEATAVMTGDIRITNDTSDIVVYRYAKPVVDFGLQRTEYIEDIQLQIDAGYSPYYSYQWQDGSTEQIYTATTSGTYRAIATDTRTSCFDGDTVTVFLIYSDVGVTLTNMPMNGCTGSYKDILVRVKNLGTSSIGKDAPIYLACDVNGTRVTLDTLVRSSNFAANATLDLILSGTIKISAGGSSVVSFYTLYGNDMKPWNDTLDVLFDALPGPVIDFGDDNGMLNTELPHILDAGSGHKSYLWQDGSTGQIFTVIQNGIYSVTVTGQNDCQTSKTVRINMPSGFGDDQEIMREIIVYPNPNNGSFRISTDALDNSNLLLKMINNQGQTVYSREFSSMELEYERIDVQHLPRGIYHIIIYAAEKSYQGKLIIE